MAGGLADRYTWGMADRNDLVDAPVAAMAARIAALWRAQGNDFLQQHHDQCEADVARLRTAVVIEPDAPAGHGERIIDRLKRLDAAAIERVAAGRTDAVVDLTGPAPIVTVPDEDGGRYEEPTDGKIRHDECSRCRQYFPEELMVQPVGERVRPLCLDCALVFSGLRRRR